MRWRGERGGDVILNTDGESDQVREQENESKEVKTVNKAERKKSDYNSSLQVTPLTCKWSCDPSVDMKILITAALALMLKPRLNLDACSSEGLLEKTPFFTLYF